MGKTVDTRVVEMSFDNKAFEKGVSITLESLKKLKEKLDFKGATQSVEALGQSFKELTLGKISENLDKLNSKFSIFGVAAAKIISDLVASTIEWGKAILNSVTGLEAALGGLQEYETQINAIQTIMANTDSKGTTMQEIMNALKGLNEYADKTIYNFTEMTRNIGTFTAAGVDLDTSVSAIKGIANAAAMSGSNSQQAATAMYQLSQAISAGVVRAQDWISVVNAGMGGEIFRTDLIETARVLGANAEALDMARENFKGSLEQEWLTSEVLLQSLSHFTGDLSKEMLILEGYTNDEADALLRLGQMANDAATKVKTFTQLKDTLKESAVSGWVQTWEYILGTFEESKTLFTELSVTLGGFIQKTADSRNEVLRLWKILGGRQLLIDSVSIAFDKLLQVLAPIGEAFREVFPPITGKTLFDLTVKLKIFLMQLEITDHFLKKVKTVFTAIFTVIKFLGTVIFTLVKGFFSIQKATLGLASGIGDLLPNLISWIKYLNESGVVIKWLNDRIKSVTDFIKLLGSSVGGFIDWGATFQWIAGGIGIAISAIVDWWNKTIDVAATMEWFKGVLNEIGSIFVALWGWIKVGAGVLYYFGTIIVATALIIKDKFLSIMEKLQPTFQSIGNFFGTIGGKLKDSYNAFKAIDTSGFVELGEKIKAPFIKLKEFFSDAGLTIDFSSIFGNIGASFDSIKKSIVSFFEGIKTYLKTAVSKMDFSSSGKALSGELAGGFSSGLEQFTKEFSGLLSAGLLTALIVSVSNFLKQGSDVLGGIAGILDGVQDSLQAWQNNLKAQTLMEIAKAIALLAASLFLLALINPVNLTFALGVLSTLFAELMIAFSNFSKMTGGGGASLPSLIATLIGISASLVILSLALLILSKLEYGEMLVGIQALAGIAIVMVGSAMLFAKHDATFAKASFGMITFAVGILSMATVVRILGNLDQEKFKAGMGVFGALAIAMVLFSRGVGEPSKVIASAASMVIMSGALIVLSIGLNAIGSVDHYKLGTGLMTTAGALAAFFLVLRYMPPAADAIGKAVAITIMAGSLVVLAYALEKLGNLDVDNAWKAIEIMAMSLGILAIAMYVMQTTLAGSAAMLIASVALIAISAAFTILSKIPMDALGIGLLAIAGIFALLGLAGMLLAPLLPVIMGLSIALTLISVGAFLFGVGVLKLSVGLLALIGIGTAGVAALTAVILGFAAILPSLITLLGLAFKALMDQIIINMPLMEAALIAMLEMLINTFIAIIPQIGEAVIVLITELARVVIEGAPALVAAAFFLIMELMRGLRDNIGPIVEVGIEAITNFINGVTEKIPDLVTSAVDLMIAFNEAMVDEIPRLAQSGWDTIIAIVDEIGNAVDDNIETLIDEVAELGIAIIDGIIKGISGESVMRLVAAIEQIGADIITWLKAALGINSPSKPAIGVGLGIGEGLILGLAKSIKPTMNATKDLAKATISSLSTAVSKASDFFTDNFDMSPTIRPVVDMTDIIASGNKLNNIYSANRSINLSSSMRRANEISTNNGSISTNDLGNVSTQNISLVQNNYSPKALSNLDIYRQTRNQLNTLKGLVTP